MRRFPPVTPSSSTSTPLRKRRKIKAEEDPEQSLFIPPSPPPSATQTPIVARNVTLGDTGAAGLQLIPEQQHAIDLILEGHNVFITAPAGCGKSALLMEAIRQLRNNGKTVHITAPTGLAAQNIGGTTLHSYAGWGSHSQKLHINKLENSAERGSTQKKMEQTDVLVIDEISMVGNYAFTRLDRVIRRARDRDDEAFGGVQLIVFGDFCQLPPIKPFENCWKSGHEMEPVPGSRPPKMKCSGMNCTEEDEMSEQWAFCSRGWKNADFKNIFLKTNHRQRDDSTGFVKILNKLGLGESLSQTEIDLLHDHPCDVKGGIKLFPIKKQVEDENRREFKKLNTREVMYSCLDDVRWNREHRQLQKVTVRSRVDDSLVELHEHPYANELSLKKDMPVILLTNLDVPKGLVNGSQGKIIGFESFEQALRATGFANADEDGGRHGAHYSGVRGGEYAAHRQEQVKEYLNSAKNRHKDLPIVQFNNGIRETIFPDCRLTLLGDELPWTLLTRTQLPVMPAWAMTIHKSQGMTMDKVIADLSRAFETGQEYVALSRAKKLSGLKVVGLGSGLKSGGANKRVEEFLADQIWE